MHVGFQFVVYNQNILKSLGIMVRIRARTRQLTISVSRIQTNSQLKIAQRIYSLCP
jgi:hypothetical protein